MTVDVGWTEEQGRVVYAVKVTLRRGVDPELHRKRLALLRCAIEQGIKAAIEKSPVLGPRNDEEE